MKDLSSKISLTYMDFEYAIISVYQISPESYQFSMRLYKEIIQF